MDILRQIKSKLAKVSPQDRPDGINAVLSHIDIAERYYEKASEEKDENYYTDVVYRTNHAFEGILKEAYEIIAEKDASKTTPHKIELYLSENSIFNERVLNLFTNYRQNWRNPSTHDYQLFFGSQEAFLAIITVSSFVSILIDQIIEKLSYISYKIRVLNYVDDFKKLLSAYDSLPYIDKCLEILKSYSKYFQEDFEHHFDLPEAELIGSITGFFAAFEPSWKIVTNQALSHEGSKVYPDILIEADNGERLIVEVKRNKSRDYSMFFDFGSPALEQLKTYMKKGGVERGIAYYTPAHGKDEIVSSYQAGTQDSLREIYSIDPEMLPDEEGLGIYDDI